MIPFSNKLFKFIFLFNSQKYLVVYFTLIIMIKFILKFIILILLLVSKKYLNLVKIQNNFNLNNKQHNKL